MSIDFLFQIFEKYQDQDAILWNNERYSYRWLLNRIHFWQHEMEVHEIFPGMIVALEGDFSPDGIALFLALTNKNCIIVPLLNIAIPDRETKFNIAQVEFCFHVDRQDTVQTKRVSHSSDHEFFRILRAGNFPGLILFSSGTSGEPKAAVHNFAKLLEKFKTPRPSLRMLNFLLFDHWGGLNTMLHALSNGGTVLTVQERSPDDICAAIEQYQIEVLPASPTFLNLLLLSEAYQRHDLSSLKIISYGTEPMPESTLQQVKELYPKVKLQQTYGLIELGVLRSKSKSSDSLWVKIGGEGFQTRVVDGILQIKADSAMMGYLNAPSPFTEDGWFHTGDAVEVDGEYLKILGRKSELINVGGEKVYPAEVESVIQEIDNVAEVTVYKKSHPFTGNIVCAKIRLAQEESDPKSFIRNLKRYCQERLAKYKVPVKVVISDESQSSQRFKKARHSVSSKS